MNLRAGIQVFLLVVMLLAPLRVRAQTPEPMPASPAGTDAPWRATDVIGIDLDARVASISPDGTQVAGINGEKQLCILAVDSQVSTCVEQKLLIRNETVVWSPDGTAIAFALEAVKSFSDSDIYVYEVASGQLMNLTDDGFTGDVLEAREVNAPIDDAPAWSPDSKRIAFARSSYTNDVASTSIMSIGRTGGEPVEVYRLPLAQEFAVWFPMRWLPDDSILYTQTSRDRDSVDDGIWRLDVSGAVAPSHLVPGAHGSEIPEPLVMDVEPDAGLALAYARFPPQPSPLKPEDIHRIWLLDLESGATSPLPNLPTEPGGVAWIRASAAAFSPDGSAFIAAYMVENDNILAVTDIDTGTMTLLDHSFTGGIGPELLDWAGNGLVLLPTPSQPSLVRVVAPASPVASPVASPSASGAGWRVGDVRELDIGTRYAAFSPDGQHLAGLGPDDTFCTWDVATLAPDCVEERLPIREETITWSPDSTAVTFSLDAIRLLYESDIYVYELTTGDLANLTDDGVEGDLLETLDSRAPIDDVPAWSPDSQRIAFVRSYWGDEGSRSTTIMWIDRAGGEPVEMLPLDVDEPMAVWLPMHWLPDGTLLYSQISQDLSDPKNGVWRMGADDGSSPLQIVPGSEDTEVPGPKISDADQGKAIVYSYFLAGQFGAAVDQPLFWLVDLDTGERMPLPEPPQEGGVRPRVIEAALSPDGATALLVTMSSEGPFLMAMDMDTGEVVSLDSEPHDTVFSQHAPQWAANNRVLLQTPTGPVLVMLERAS